MTQAQDSGLPSHIPSPLSFDMFDTYPYLALTLAFLAHCRALPNASSTSSTISTSAVILPPNIIGIGRSYPMSLGPHPLAPPVPPSLLTDLINILPHGGGLNTTVFKTSSAEAPSSGPPSADTVNSATLLLCQNTDCGGCQGFDLNAAPRDACLVPSESSFQFWSVAISQPRDSGLPYGVLVGPGGCTEFSYIPRVNTCYDVPNPPFTEFAINDGN
ncbi:hypothetical protein C8Q80DRAFT_152650 [Daedaleopsis nitida]|nr:hypothetical protein C8Q80DRAFT_152650 [Daedaleopsis nitida]